MNGKGSKYRTVDREKYNASHDRIFNVTKKEERNGREKEVVSK